MKVQKQRHVGPPRTTMEEANQIIGRIPIFSNMFQKKSAADIDHSLAEEQRERLDTMASMGLMFASRFLDHDEMQSGLVNRAAQKKLAIQEHAAKRGGHHHGNQERHHHGHMGHPDASMDAEREKKDRRDSKARDRPSLADDDLKPAAQRAGTPQESKHQSSNNLKKKQRFAMSLATLSARAEKRETLVEEGAIAALIDLADINDPTIQKSCASAFSQLAKEPSIRSQMLAEGVVGTLVALSSSSSNLVKLDCARGICNLFCDSNCEIKALRDNVPMLLLRVVQECPEAYEAVLTAVLNLSCVSEKIPRIEELNEVLLQLYNFPKIKENQLLIVLQTLCNLSALRSNQLKLVEDGCLKIVDKVRPCL